MQKKKNLKQEELGSKYKHLEPYFCMLERLPEFRFTYSPHKPKEDQVIGA